MQYLTLEFDKAVYLIYIYNSAEDSDEQIIYPNPSEKEISIETDLAFISWIYDGLGRNVQEINLEKGINIVNVQNLEPGIYYIKNAYKSIGRFIKTGNE